MATPLQNTLSRTLMNGNLTINGNISVNSTNIALGLNAAAGTVGTNTVAIGSQAGQTNLGTDSIAIGYNTSVSQLGSQSTAVGSYSGYNQTGSYNTFIGREAGYDSAVQRTGSYNTYIGYAAQANASNYSSSTAIGIGAVITASNQIKLGTASENVSIPGPLSTAAITANGLVGINGTNTGSYNLYVNGSVGCNTVHPPSGALTLGTAYGNNTYMGTTNGWGFFPTSASSGTMRYNYNLQGLGGTSVAAYIGVGLVNVIAMSTGTTNGTYLFFNLGSQKVYLQDYTSSGTLSVDVGGRLVGASDRRVKNNIVYITDTNNLEKIKQLKPCSFYFNDSDYPNKKIGFIAQDVETVIPDAVDGKKYEYKWKVDENNKPILDADGNLIMTDQIRPKNIDNTAILAFLVKGTQELIAIVESQQTLISNLEARLSALENK